MRRLNVFLRKTFAPMAAGALLLAAALAFARAIDGRIPAVATTPRQTSPS